MNPTKSDNQYQPGFLKKKNYPEFSSIIIIEPSLKLDNLCFCAINHKRVLKSLIRKE